MRQGCTLNTEGNRPVRSANGRSALNCQRMQRNAAYNAVIVE